MKALPLFALPMVACPHELVPLHIFEPRYRALLAHCRKMQADGKPGEFVVAHSGGSELKRVGCVVRLVKVLKEYEDGRMDIVAAGVRRVVLGAVTPEPPFPVVTAQAYTDERTDWDEQLATEAFNLHRGLIQVITGQKPKDKLYAGIPDLSFLIASSVSLDVGRKQELIESRSEDDRLRYVINAMSGLLRQVEYVQNAARAIQGYWELQKVFGAAGSGQQSA